jgi:predicted phage tail protein
MSTATKVTASTARYSAVTGLKATDKTATSVTLTWAVSKFSETTHYEIVWKEGGVEQSTTVDSTGGIPTVTIGNLTPSKRYTFSIRAIVKAGDDIIQQSLTAKILVTTARMV